MASKKVYITWEAACIDLSIFKTSREKCIEAISEYFASLNNEGKYRYQDKLELLRLTLKEDPFDIENEKKNFVCDMTLWPPLEHGHIFCYFIERPGVYTKRQLLQWKSLDSYNYFQSGHVREVKIMILSRGNCLLKALVNPGQKSPSHPY